ncbi:hypothetical protein FOXB_00802 [Fusarium oxysporum f. sp. conglutinans Fo5176]|uniref:Uncharacterized protein n=1 Tax=Fusarium oxysporum (strain Fo5176) TaxID=660025 RepID=F9F327_FUSOF|nr:hypothetical protein FOXB_00802 [Fusarium oxysporum f. sp. conglutinans Fo5176]
MQLGTFRVTTQISTLL